jgi:hypothetical protein
MLPKTELENGRERTIERSHIEDPSFIVAGVSSAVCRHCGGQINQAPQRTAMGIDRNSLPRETRTALAKSHKKHYSTPTLTVFGKFVFVKR